MSGRAILMPMRLTDLLGAPPSRATNFKVALAALVLVATAFSSAALVHFAAPRSGGQAMLWREISWPFPRDGWPAGRAFRCESCGGGRFGSHSSNESMAPVYYKKMVFIAFFNAGVRALDIRDPYHPLEVGYFIPSITKATDKRCVTVDGKERCKVAIQTNNVETDERGYVYIVDRANTGMHILELTGEAHAAVSVK